MSTHKAGFVTIAGKPNVGKSTLLNALVGEKLAIVTPKAQTTRHRIRGIINGEDYQIVFSDTPGILKSAYLLHDKMMEAVESALTDADVICYVTEAADKTIDEVFIAKLSETETPVMVLINKMDTLKLPEIEAAMAFWREKLPKADVLVISAQEKFQTDILLNRLISLMPTHPPFFDKDTLTDRNVRFFVAEIIREKVFLSYQKEVPYSTEVIVESYKEQENIDKITAVIYVERESQKGIIIGHKGENLKRLGIDSRKDIEEFVGKKVYLELIVKVKEGWREKPGLLRNFGYENF